MELADRGRSMARPLKVGLFGIGLEAYWPQFEGLENRLRRYVGTVEAKLARPGVEVVNLGLIDTPEKAVDAGHDFRAADIDLIFLYVTTYALSSTVLPVVRRAGVPVVILNLQPERAIDYAAFNRLPDRTRMTGEWLAHCAACPVPEIANVFTRAGIPTHQITGVLEGDAHVDAQIEDWVEAARVAHVMAHNRLGVMGHYYNGMLDIYSDLTAQCAAFGTIIDFVEMDELAEIRNSLADAEVDAMLARIEAEFDIQSDCAPEELHRAARTAAALVKLVDTRGLGSMAYFYVSVPDHEHEDIISSVILGCSLLTASGVPVAGEYEIKNAQAMKIMDAFGAGGSFTEYYAIDYEDDVVLMGHDGPGHTKIAEGKTKVRPLEVYHGKVGKGVSVEMSVRHGPVTLLSVIERAGKVELLVAEGESVPGPILEIGNTNSRYRFVTGARAFSEAWNAAGPAHHCAVGVGHIAGRIEKLAKLLDLQFTRVC
ncbi:arabinose isomerase [Pelagibacterium xiamenense]|uniref:arabinose isomerase n=1 Tax=Pelagibacterium xiamenense TaxID=2901140 RepID=UPI001E2C3AFF|nr:arabinose isomerase [Pelagibacterium xiamenense]MCD7060616.1 arabinose isomerase [Pelagibacterium xiamenense]